jgi:hypothetical protein
MNLTHLLLFLFIFSTQASKAQEKTSSISSKKSLSKNLSPHIAGKLIINMKAGTIQADLKLSNLPALDTAFRIRLHHGMNIKFTTSAPRIDCFLIRGSRKIVPVSLDSIIGR